MMSTHDTVPENLAAGTRALEALPAITLLSAWQWDARFGIWVIHCRLAHTRTDDASYSETTDWYIVASDAYPAGDVDIYPAKVRGIPETYPHQLFNGVGDKSVSWRSGKLCLDTSVHVLDRHGLGVEPRDIYYRLRWYVERALSWVDCARSGTLVRDGDPFELPDYPAVLDCESIGFVEDDETFRQWQTTTKRVGLVTMGRLRKEPSVRFIKSFQTLSTHEISVARWGHALTGIDATSIGVWVRIDRCPLLAPWQAPVTWGELRSAIALQGLDLDLYLRAAVPHLRDGLQHPLFLGFPISAVVGAPASRIFWLCVRLPVLSRGTRTAPGFRPNDNGYWMRDRTTLIADAQQVFWQKSANWAADDLTGRGSLPALVAKQRIVFLGGGALGSAMAELLVRAGAYEVTIVDSDMMNAGNLVRHTLLLSDVGSAKSTGLSERLNRTSPHANVRGIVAHFPTLADDDVEVIQRADVIVDCTGVDDVLAALSTFRWSGQKRFVSFALGLFARRLYCFAAHGRYFPTGQFHASLSPWLQHEREEFAGEPLPREGIGCWHPVVPARADDVVMFASVAVKHLERYLISGAGIEGLSVYEQTLDSEGFVGIKKVAEDLGE